LIIWGKLEGALISLTGVREDDFNFQAKKQYTELLSFLNSCLEHCTKDNGYTRYRG